jgi:hypothetical protein
MWGQDSLIFVEWFFSGWPKFYKTPAPSLATPLHSIVSHSAVLCCAVLCCAVLCCAVLCCAVLCCATLHCAALWSALLYSVHVLCCTALPISKKLFLCILNLYAILSLNRLWWSQFEFRRFQKHKRNGMSKHRKLREMWSKMPGWIQCSVSEFPKVAMLWQQMDTQKQYWKICQTSKRKFSSKML